MVNCKPEDIIAKLRQTVNKGRFGIDYTICCRDKNKLLRENYIIDDSKIKTILLNLTVDDYISSEPSDNEKFPDDIVHKFISNVKMIRKYSTDIEPVDVKLYIKFTWSVSMNKKMIIISFHEANGF